MYILVLLGADQTRRQFSAPKITWLRYVLSQFNDVTDWRMYRVGDGWFDGTENAWRSINDIETLAEVLLYDPRP